MRWADGGPAEVSVGPCEQRYGDRGHRGGSVAEHGIDSRGLIHGQLRAVEPDCSFELAPAILRELANDAAGRCENAAALASGGDDHLGVLDRSRGRSNIASVEEAEASLSARLGETFPLHCPGASLPSGANEGHAAADADGPRTDPPLQHGLSSPVCDLCLFAAILCGFTFCSIRIITPSFTGLTLWTRSAIVTRSCSPNRK